MSDEVFTRHEIVSVDLVSSALVPTPLVIFAEVDGGCAWISGSFGPKTTDPVQVKVEHEVPGNLLGAQVQDPWPIWLPSVDLPPAPSSFPERIIEAFEAFGDSNGQNVEIISAALLESVPLLEAAIIMDS